MSSFEYATPQSEAEAVVLMGDYPHDTAVLAGGTDLLSLLRRGLVSPKRVVDLKSVPTLRGVQAFEGGVVIGALTTLEELAEDPLLAGYGSLKHVIDETRAIQIQANGTLGGDLCHLPNCWYYRNGYGLLALEEGRSLVDAGDDRYHAILGNVGLAKFVSASRFAPALIAWGGKVRIVGPEPDQAEWLPLEYFFTTPKSPRQGVTVLQPGQFVSHVWLPEAGNVQSATYEVLQMQGLDWPLGAAAVCVETSGGVVQNARVVLGHVAPIPWVSSEAAAALVGKPLTEETASAAAQAAVAGARPLKENGYKVQIAATAVKRALLRAVGTLV